MHKAYIHCTNIKPVSNWLNATTSEPVTSTLHINKLDSNQCETTKLHMHYQLVTTFSTRNNKKNCDFDLDSMSIAMKRDMPSSRNHARMSLHILQKQTIQKQSRMCSLSPGLIYSGHCLSPKHWLDLLLLQSSVTCTTHDSYIANIRITMHSKLYGIY